MKTSHDVHVTVHIERDTMHTMTGRVIQDTPGIHIEVQHAAGREDAALAAFDRAVASVRAHLTDMTATTFEEEA